MGEPGSSSTAVGPLRALVTAEEDLLRIRRLEDVDFGALRSVADEFAAVAADRAAVAPALRGLFDGGALPSGGCTVVEPLAVRCRGVGAVVEAHIGWAARMADLLRSAATQAETAITAAADRALDAHSGTAGSGTAGSGTADRRDADALSVLRTELDRAAAELTAIWDRLVHELAEPAAGGVTLGGTSGRSVERSTGVRLGELPDGPAAAPASVSQPAPEWIGLTSGG